MSDNKPLILLAQHESCYRPALQGELEEMGYRVIRSNSALEAFCAFYRQIPDLVITEYSLPIMNGFQLCRCLKNDLVARYTPVILLGQPEEHIERYWSYKVGLDSFLDQDVPCAVLGQEVTNILQIYEKLRTQLGKRDLKYCLNPSIQLSQEEELQEATDSASRLLQLLDKALLETTIMREFREMAALAQQPDLMNHLVFSILESIVDYDVAALFYNQNQPGRTNKLYFHCAQGKQYDEVSMRQIQQHFCSQLSKHWQFQNINPDQVEIQVILGSHPQLVHAAKPLEQEPQPLIINSHYFDRFEEGEQLQGAFALYTSKAIDYIHIFPVSLVAQELHQLMKLHSLYYAREMASQLDGVSDTFNFSYFQNVLGKEVSRARRYESDFAIALIDIDHLSAFNEEFGFAAGDELIKAVAQQAQVVFRGSDVIARAEGAALAVLLNGASLEQAQQACERLRQQMLRTPLMIKERPVSCTISIGLAPFSHENPVNSKELYTQAFEALRQAKTNGRNRTCVMLAY